mgnify:CR=1 FL=1
MSQVNPNEQEMHWRKQLSGNQILTEASDRALNTLNYTYLQHLPTQPCDNVKNFISFLYNKICQNFKVFTPLHWRGFVWNCYFLLWLTNMITIGKLTTT